MDFYILYTNISPVLLLFSFRSMKRYITGKNVETMILRHFLEYMSGDKTTIKSHLPNYVKINSSLKKEQNVGSYAFAASIYGPLHSLNYYGMILIGKFEENNPKVIVRFFGA